MQHCKALPALGLHIQTSSLPYPLHLQSAFHPHVTLAQMLPDSQQGRQPDCIRCCSNNQSLSQARHTNETWWLIQPCRLPPAGGKVRLLHSIQAELWMAQPGWSLNIAGQRKGCESGWGREWNRSQMSNQLNTTIPCWSTSKTFPLYYATFCSRVFKHSFRIKSMNANSENKRKTCCLIYTWGGENTNLFNNLSSWMNLNHTGVTSLPQHDSTQIIINHMVLTIKHVSGRHQQGTKYQSALHCKHAILCVFWLLLWSIYVRWFISFICIWMKSIQLTDEPS